MNFFRHDIHTLQFSYYNYIPQSVIDDRYTFRVSIECFLEPDFIAKLFYDTPINKELAFHSNIITTSGEVMHIPMVDMSTGSAAQLNKLKSFLDDSIFQRFKWYKSGRSYHGYCGILINEREWLILMGRLLLANQIGFPPTVDPRWVGHRLIAGYATLRWTKNTPHYIGYPREI
ncbi:MULTISPECIES: hypothetical protein [Shewanella]|uniref:primase 1D-like protein n=1 Tax=Shewanella TaxID=22 RepID=UPI00131F2B57|nr:MULTISPECIES: hypothetical protein [Shewanella]MCI2964930.1 hypothetical protein [Shewanella sp. N2AIL]